MARLLFTIPLAIFVILYAQNIAAEEDALSSSEDYEFGAAEEYQEWTEEDPTDHETDNQIMLQSATSVESVLLEAIRSNGPDVCLSPFARLVMLGTWRTEMPTPEELRDSIKLRQTCYNSSLNPRGIHRSLPHFYFAEDSEHSERTNNASNSESNEDLVFSMMPNAVAVPNTRMSRLGPPVNQKASVATVKNAVPNEKDTQKINEILKDRSADCKPHKVPVPIQMESNMTWKPSCALVERCGGCCQHESFHCVPTPDGVSVIKKKVAILDPKSKYIGMETVSVEKHNKCKCVCKIQAKDCNELQTYDSRNCRCVCKVSGTKPKGGRPACTKPLYWDERTCKCRCPEQTITECSTGSYFSSERCRCVTALDIIKDESKRIQKNRTPTTDGR